ncbi:translation initiation factor IF-2-like [Impatiens glandulifera]|uniref:translation initiation factor IF-2-like n=1 Tax=Impatiens glandulifera TaxID=253017 RepID=UPI001FB057B8|nr:translation initiation factor IF-2-like [Impatiens glandulifera]
MKKEEADVEEAAQAPFEENVVISLVVRTEEAQEKVAEVTQPEIIRSEGETSKDKDVEEESSSSEEEHDQYRAEDELLEEEQNEAAKVAEKDQPEQSMQIHTNFEAIQSMEAKSQENSSNEESSTKGNKILKSMTSVLSSLQKSMIKALNTQEEERKDFSEIIKEFADSITRKFQAKENAKANAERDQPRITQGESSRRSDGVSTVTRSRRAPCNDDNPRPTKRGGGRSGGDRGGRSSDGGRGRQSGLDQRGRASGGDRGGR